MNATPAANIDSAAVVGHYINGADVSDTNRPLPVTNPATGEITRHVAMATKATVEDAIAAAETAYPAWRNTPPAKRARELPMPWTRVPGRTVSPRFLPARTWNRLPGPESI